MRIRSSNISISNTDEDDDISEGSLVEGEIKPKRSFSEIVQRLSRLSTHMVHKEKKLREEYERAKPIESIIGPDGYVPNSEVRSAIPIYYYKPYDDIPKPRNVSLGPGLLGTVYYCLQRFNIHEKPQISLNVTEAAFQVLKKFQQNAVLEESRLMSTLYREAMKHPKNEDQNLENMINSTLMKQAHKLRKKRVTNKQKNVIKSFLRQQVIPDSKKSQIADSRKSFKTVSASEVLLSPTDYNLYMNRLVDKYGSIDAVFASISVMLHIRASETTEHIPFINTLGSEEILKQFVATMKLPRNIKDYWIHMLGRKHFYNLVSASITCNFDAIAELTQVLGGDISATVNYITMIEKTINAATACLQTSACNFHHVHNFITQLLTRPWVVNDLEDLANGRYQEQVKPGEVPNTNPLLSVQTKMTEDQFKEFYYALIEGNYKYFKTLGNLEYEISKARPPDSLKYSLANDKTGEYNELVYNLADPVNRYLLRPTNEIFRGLANSLIYLPKTIEESTQLPTFHTKYFAQMAKKHVIITSSEILLEIKDKVQPLEKVAKMISRTIKIFRQASEGLIKASKGSILIGDACNIISQIMQGNMDECYRVKTIINPMLGALLINSMQVTMGRMVDRILRFSFLSEGEADFVHLFNAFIDRNYREEIMCSLLNILVTLGKLAFKLSKELMLFDNVPILQKLLREPAFFKAVGCNKKTVLEHINDRIESLYIRPEFMPQEQADTLSKRISLKNKAVIQQESASLDAIDSFQALGEPHTDGAFSPLIKWTSDIDISDDYDHTSSTSVLDNQFVKGIKSTEFHVELKQVVELKKNENDLDNIFNEAWLAVTALQEMELLKGSINWNAKEMGLLKMRLLQVLQEVKKNVELTNPQLLFLIDVGRRINMSPEQSLAVLWKALNNVKSRGLQHGVEKTYGVILNSISILKEDIQNDSKFLNKVESIEKFFRPSESSDGNNYSVEFLSPKSRPSFRRKVSHMGSFQQPRLSQTAAIPKLRESNLKKQIMEKMVVPITPTKKTVLFEPQDPMNMLDESLNIEEKQYKTWAEEFSEIIETVFSLAKEKSTLEIIQMVRGNLVTSLKTRNLTEQEASDIAMDIIYACVDGREIQLNAFTKKIFKFNDHNKLPLNRDEFHQAFNALAGAYLLRSGLPMNKKQRLKAKNIFNELLLRQSLTLPYAEIISNNILKQQFKGKDLGVNNFESVILKFQRLTRSIRKTVPVKKYEFMSWQELFNTTQHQDKFSTAYSNSSSDSQTSYEPWSTSSSEVSSDSRNLRIKKKISEVEKQRLSRQSKRRSEFTQHSHHSGSLHSLHTDIKSFVSETVNPDDVHSDNVTSESVGSFDSIKSNSSGFERHKELLSQRFQSLISTKASIQTIDDENEISIIEVIEHIVDCLASCTSLSKEMLHMIHVLLLEVQSLTFLNEKLARIMELASKDAPSSIFAQDDNRKLMRTFVNLVHVTAVIKMSETRTNPNILVHLDRQVDEVLTRFAIFASIYLAPRDWSSMRNALKVLMGNKLISYDSWLNDEATQNVASAAYGGYTNKLGNFSMRELIAFLQNKMDEDSRVSVMLPRLSSTRIDADVSWVVVGKTILPLLQLSTFDLSRLALPLKRFLQRTQEKLDTKLKKHLVDTMKTDAAPRTRDIERHLASVLSDATKLQRRVSIRLHEAGIKEFKEPDTWSKNISPLHMAQTRIVGRPSWIKPGEWYRLAGKNAMSAFRLDNPRVCHRAKGTFMEPLVAGDKFPGLSHNLITNYDLLNILNRNSLEQRHTLLSTKAR